MTAFFNEVCLEIAFATDGLAPNPMSHSKVKISNPALPFAEKARRPGGLSRQAAIAGAMQGVESLRDESIVVIADTVTEIERILAADGSLSTEELHSLLRHSDRIVTLAQTFGYTVTAFVAKSLCDLLQSFVETGKRTREPLEVHASSLRLAMPPGAVTQEDSERILGELSRILVFYGCTPREEVRLRAMRKLGLPDGRDADSQGQRKAGAESAS